MLYVVFSDFADGSSGNDQRYLNRVRLFGPFETGVDACRYFGSPSDFPELFPAGTTVNPNNPHDNTCWEVVDLDAPVVEVVVPVQSAGE